MNELSSARTMTVREVAGALDVEERTVQRHIRAIRANSDNVVGVAHGKTTHITEAEATEIKRRIERSGRNDLDNVVQAREATTDLEMMAKIAEVMAWTKQKISEYQAQIETMQPKAEFFDTVADSRDAISIRDAASVLNRKGLGQNNLFALLRSLSVLDGGNAPYREYIERGYFRVIEQTWTDRAGEPHVSTKTLVTQRGLQYLARLLPRAERKAVTA
jgi:phage antirepressor YoqD-like protein